MIGSGALRARSVLLAWLSAAVVCGCAGDPEELSPSEYVEQNSQILAELGSYDAAERYDAIAKLQSEGVERASAVAIVLLTDSTFEDARARVVLARMLAAWGDRRAIPYLLSYLDHPDGWVVQIAGDGLLNFQGELTVLEELEERLSSERLRDRIAAANILRRMNGRKIVELCASRYGEEEDREVRALLLIAITEGAHPRRRSYLVEALDDNDEGLRKQAWGTLRQYGDLPATTYRTEDGPEERAGAVAALREWANRYESERAKR